MTTVETLRQMLADQKRQVKSLHEKVGDLERKLQDYEKKKENRTIANPIRRRI